MKQVAKKRRARNWHPRFVKYMESIVNHENYLGMPDPRKKDGSIRWVVTGKSSIGQARAKWWDEKRAALGIPREGPWMSKVARRIHPTGEKPCQTCGRTLKLDYVYPTKWLLAKLNRLTGGKATFSQLQPIPEILHKLLKLDGAKTFDGLGIIFGIPDTIKKDEKEYLGYILENRKGRLSPGAMSNPPDRFDGYHSYNLCCRSKEDTGRHKDNLMRYGEDRRAYEFWSDGDWKAASWLMQEFRKHRVSPDHIGPLSLGFAHRPKFKPMTRHQNIGKGNRMSYADVETLISDELSGAQVVSWHSKYIWNLLKNEVKTDKDALRLSKLMRRNLHQVLRILFLVHNAGYDDFLVRNFLHPEHAKYAVRFIGFDVRTGDYKKIIKKRGEKKQYENNARRYIRKSLKALEEYDKKGNRKVSMEGASLINAAFQDILAALKENREHYARQLIEAVLTRIAQDAQKRFLSEN